MATIFLDAHFIERSLEITSKAPLKDTFEFLIVKTVVVAMFNDNMKLLNDNVKPFNVI